MHRVRHHFLMLLLASFAATSPLVTAQTPRSGEVLDLTTISRIREEGLKHSHIIEYASELTDEIGPRLTGSPEFEHGAQWAIAKLQAIGVENAHEESWGDFGMAWTQLGTTLLLEKPVPGTLVAQATPWSPATKGDRCTRRSHPGTNERVGVGSMEGKAGRQSGAVWCSAGD